MAEAELMITPEVAMSSLRKSMDKIDKEMKKSASNMEKYFEGALENAGKKGGKKMSDGMMKHAKSAKKWGIASGVALASAALLYAPNLASSKVESAEDSINSVLGDKDATMNISFAKGQGMSNIDLSKMMYRSQMAGGDDQTMRDFIIDSSDYIMQAKAGTNSLLSQFTDEKGSDQFNAILASLAGKKSDDINQFLAAIGWAGDSGVIYNMLNGLEGRTGKDAKDYLDKNTATDKKNSDNMVKEAGLEKIFSEMMVKANINIKSGLLGGMNKGMLDEYQKGIELQGQDKIKAITGYKENKENMLKIEAKKRELDVVMLDVFNWVFKFVIPWANKIIAGKTDEDNMRDKKKQAYKMLSHHTDGNSGIKGADLSKSGAGSAGYAAYLKSKGK